MPLIRRAESSTAEGGMREAASTTAGKRQSAEHSGGVIATAAL